MSANDCPVGFRFYPNEEELLSFYLHRKIYGNCPPSIDSIIPLLHIYDYDPPDLPRNHSPLGGEQWFFFVPMRGKEARNGRTNRLTPQGYWKATGTQSDVNSSQHQIIGRKRTMVFYAGRAPTGRKTPWKMNEYKAVETPSSLPTSQVREELSLCRIYNRPSSGRAFQRRTLRGLEAAEYQQRVEPAVEKPSNGEPKDAEAEAENMAANGFASWDLESIWMNLGYT